MIDYQTALVVACVRSEDAFINAQGMNLPKEAFELPEAQAVWDALCTNFSEGIPHSKVELFMRLKEAGMADDVEAWLSLADTEIEDISPHSKWLEHVAESWTKRQQDELLTTARQLMDEGAGVNEVLDYMKETATAIEDATQLEEHRIKRRATEVAQHNSERIKGNVGLVSTGIDFIDHQCGKLKTHEFVVLAGRPGSGKSSFAREVMMGPVKESKKPVMLFTLEMPTDEVVMALASTRSGVSTRNIEDDFEPNKEKLDAQQKRFSAALGKWLLVHEFVHDIRDIERMVGVAMRRHRPALILIDYLQLVTASHLKVSREREVAYISGRLKMMANIHRVPVIALAQLNRMSEQEEREPRASDLRESGSLEQDADAIWLIHKPKEPKRCGNVEERKFIQAKRRGGEVEDFNIGFIGKTTKFVFKPIESMEDEKRWNGKELV